jgi:putative Mn2+ efflux pump MntP
LDILSTVLIALGLAMDTFAVSLGISTTNQTRNYRQIFRLSFHFGLFQGLMTLLGWLAGSAIERWITSIDHWAILVLLGWIGIRMIINGFDKNEKKTISDPSRGVSLVLLSVATSLDALAVGIGLAFLNVNIAISSSIIAVVTFIISTIGGFTGSSLGNKFGKRMEIIGGIVLLGIGIRILITHIFNL